MQCSLIKYMSNELQTCSKSSCPGLKPISLYHLLRESVFVGSSHHIALFHFQYTHRVGSRTPRSPPTNEPFFMKPMFFPILIAYCNLKYKERVLIEGRNKQGVITASCTFARTH